jgi:1-acyl-sn-glycerol-3-phosphate acyltransferase/nucleoside-diphosphate-sugar epimerase
MTPGTSRVRIAVPAALERVLVPRLAAMDGFAVVNGTAGDADVLVFAPLSPPSGASDATVRDALSAAASLAREPVTHVVAISSAAVYGASPYSPGFVDEGWQPPATDRNRIALWWRSFEQELFRLLPQAALTILRPAPVLDGDSFVSHLFRAPAALTLSGHDPSIQLLAPDDLAAAVERAVVSGIPGTFNIAPAGVLPLRKALAMASRFRVPLPRLWQRAARAPLSAAGLAWPADHLDFIRYSTTISGARSARALGFTATRSSARALAEFTGAERREGDATDFDPFGQDKSYIDRYNRTFFAFLADYYWRIEAEGLESLPTTGRAVLSGPHRGFMPFDGTMLLRLAVRQRGRYVRFLIHPSLVKFPFLADFMTKLGGIPACRENADWVLQNEEIVGIFPEGIHGAFTPYKRAYRLGKFGRDEFVKAALRNRAPIVPFATVGSAEIFPILAKLRWPWWERLTDWPYFPVTPTFPLAPIPLPSKWHIRFLPAVHLADAYSPASADDPRAVREISDAVRAQIQGAMDDMLARRRWVFFGSIFDGGTGGPV